MFHNFKVVLRKMFGVRCNSRKLKILLIGVVFLCCFSGFLIWKNINAYGDDGYAIGSNGSAVLPHTTSGDIDIWPITEPVFIVQLYSKIDGMSTDNGSYDGLVESIKTVIPYATEDAMWLCSNLLSEYMIRHNFHTSEQVYFARKTSLSLTQLNLVGGRSNPDALGRIKYLSRNKNTTFGGNINQGVFYKEILDLFIANNRSMALLAKDSEFLKYLNTDDESKLTNSLELWSYITDVKVIPVGGGSEYEIYIKEKIDEFLHVKELYDAGLDFNKWNDSSTSKFTTNGYTITAADCFNLRYLDLLMTLNIISNNKTYWSDGIKSFMTDNNGSSNISITQGIIGRFESVSTEGGNVKPATVFMSCNDLTQDAYRVQKNYNLSDLIPSNTVYENVNKTDYINRLKGAVSLSESNTYYTDSIYSPNIISRVISERVRSVVNNRLSWGSSNNPLNLSGFLKFNFKGDTWDGTNWVLEPPITTLAINYQAILTLNSKDLDKINKKVKKEYKKDNSIIDLVKYYVDRRAQQKQTVITDDDVNLQVTLKALTSQGNSQGQENSIDEWTTFIKKNNITEFRLLIKLNRNFNGTAFTSIPIEGRDFKQIYTNNVEWCTSTDWETVTSEKFLELLRGKIPLGQWSDDTISKLKVSDKEEKDIIYSAKVYIQYKATDKKWYYTTGKADETAEKDLIEAEDISKIPDIRLTNKVEIKYTWNRLPVYLNFPSSSWHSEEPALAYAELKEGSIYNETFEAMAGVPSTRTLYFSSGGNEFMVDLRVDYEPDRTAIREYISHYNGTECEFKKNDQLKGGTGSYSKTEAFVGDGSGKTISKNVVAESSKIVEPDGSKTKNITVNNHTSNTDLWAEWKGTIGNGTQEPADIGKFDPGKPGTPCAGLGFDPGTLRTKDEPSTSWEVDTYNQNLEQAISWAKAMEATNSTYTVQKIADSDGQTRQYQVGDAVITVTLNGGDNSYTNTKQRSYSGGNYTSSSAAGASLTSSDKGRLGSGWGWNAGKLGVGSGYSDCGHGHNASGWHVEPKEAVPPDENGNGGSPAVPGVKHSHNCGSYTPGQDITQGASGIIDYTIKVTFQNGTLKAENYDGNSSDVTAAIQTGLTGIPAHALCGPCCIHDLPAIEDVWYQEVTYDTIQITKCNVYKIEKGYVTDMSEITYDSDKNLIASITQGDPNIFYNIAADNQPEFRDEKITNASKIGRIRYSLQEAQGDRVYYEEMSKGVEKRTNKCDGLSRVQSPQNPAPLAKKGHELGFASGILYSNGSTSGYGNAPGISITTEDFVSDNKATSATLKPAYTNKMDSKDLLTDEWKRFYTRRTQEVTATVISDMLILQTSSGDQSPVYYEEITKAKAQEDFPSLQASGDVKKASTQDEIDRKWLKMWENNGFTFANTKPDAINIGSYNGKYNLTAAKYQGTGKKEKITTRFDNDMAIFSSAADELGLATVRSSQSYSKPVYGAANISSPGKSQARMDRVTDLLIYIDKIKQNPINKNAQYETGESFVFYRPVLKYKLTGEEAKLITGEEVIKDVFSEAENEVLKGAGYKCGPGLLYKSRYSAYDDGLEDKVNNIIVLDAVSTQNAMIVKSEVEDQRTEEGIVKDAMDTLKALEKCPGTPELCEYRYLSCKYTLDTTSLSFNFEDKITESSNSGEKDIYSSYDGQMIASSIKNKDGAFPAYELPKGTELTSGDSNYSGFGTGGFIKITGNGTRLQLPFNDCKISRNGSSRVQISADVFIPVRPENNMMLFSIGGVGLYLPRGGSSPAFITSKEKTRTGTVTNIIGRKVKITVTFSLGSLYDCELEVDGIKVISQITSGVTEEQIAEAAIEDDMRGSSVNMGSWDFDNSFSTNFYLDNVIVKRCGGILEHTASCYTTYKKERSFYQDTFNGLTSLNNSIDWTRNQDDGYSYDVITSFSKHVHDTSCLTQSSEGYQIALAEAREGNWDTLKKELGTELFEKLVSNFKIDVSSGSTGNIKSGDILNYSYSGNVQTVILPKGIYTLETYGAQGGNDSTAGGNGGYAKGTLTLLKSSTLYLQVGGQGASSASGSGGGYNGGGHAGTIGSSGGGGGATSIATANGSLSSLLQNNETKNKVLLVAGGGGGAGNNHTVTSNTPSTIPYTGNTSYTTRNGTLAKSFIAAGNGTVTFKSTDFTADPYGFIYVYDSTGALRSSTSDDDSGGSLHFSCSANVYQGDRVEFYAGAYRDSGSCSWKIEYTVLSSTTTYVVGAGGSGGGPAGGNGGEVYNAQYNGIGGSSASYYNLGQGQSHTGDGGGGGGGYYGGFAAAADAGGGGGSGYVSSQLTGGSLNNGINSGNGKIVITVLEANRFPDETELFHFIKSEMHLIPDWVTTDGVTIVNPIWDCRLINNTEKVYTVQTLLTCMEPHHSGGHYDYSNDICWSACEKNENHKTTIEETIDANGVKVEQAAYITLDNFFKVYFPNTGDFYGNGAYGIPEPVISRGRGYSQNMDTTEWTREKYVKFDYDVLYERNGVWENHTAGEWIPLEIVDKTTTRKYALSDGTTLKLQGNTYLFDMTNYLLNYNGGSTTLLEGGTLAVIDGKIFELNNDGTVNVSSPKTEYNFYCLLANDEVSCAEVQYAAEGINYNRQSSKEMPYAGDGIYQNEFSVYNYGNLYATNKQRFYNFTAKHTAAKLAYLDIVGRIGNFIIEDTDDMRFSNFFKKPIAENRSDWYIEGIISNVDSSITENYLSWHRNSAGYPLAVDVRGEQVNEANGYYNTWGTQGWTVKANSQSMGVSADKNTKAALQEQQLKLGYNVMFDITSLGNYNQYLQVIPYFYALNTSTNEMTPVDIYITDDGVTRPINYFGLYSEYMDDNGNYLKGYEELSKNLYRYNMYLNWTSEAARRNYTSGGMESQVTDRVRDYFTEEVYGSNGEITGYKYLTVPYGNYFNLGTIQCLQPGRRARTFVGNSSVTAIRQQAARLGITVNGINGGINTNLNGAYRNEMFYRQAQRWHLTLGLPSSAVFTAYREKGVHITPEDEWYETSYLQEGKTKTKQFSKVFLLSKTGNNEYAIGDRFQLDGIEYTITGKYSAGKEFNGNNDYVIIMTADIKAIGEVWNLKYETGDDNGNISIRGKKYHFGSSIPTFIAAYDTVSSLVDISTEHTH